MTAQSCIMGGIRLSFTYCELVRVFEAQIEMREKSSCRCHWVETRTTVCVTGVHPGRLGLHLACSM